jgi:hypothetical protein
MCELVAEDNSMNKSQSESTTFGGSDSIGFRRTLPYLGKLFIG